MLDDNENVGNKESVWDNLKNKILHIKTIE